MTAPTSPSSVWGVHDYVASYTAATVAEQLVGRGDMVDSSKLIAGNRGGGPSGCGWYRIIVPLAELGRRGWLTQWRAGVPPQAADEYKIITAQRLDKQDALPIWRKLRLSHRLVYETDDDIFSVPAERWKHATYPQQVMEAIVEHAAQIADIVTVSTEPLAEVYRERGCHDVRVLHNCIPGAVIGMNRNRNRRRLIVGWVGGGSHGPDLELVAEPVREFLDGFNRRSPKRPAEMHVFGSNFTDVLPGARYTEWVAANESLAYYRQFDFDIGLAPLRGTVFDQSKSYIKALEYMAHGIPVLASDVEPYRGFVIDGVNGYLIRRQNEWLPRLRELANDTQAREEMGAKAMATARLHTIEANWHKWADVYKELL